MAKKTGNDRLNGGKSSTTTSRGANADSTVGKPSHGISRDSSTGGFLEFREKSGAVSRKTLLSAASHTKLGSAQRLAKGSWRSNLPAGRARSRTFDLQTLWAANIEAGYRNLPVFGPELYAKLKAADPLSDSVLEGREVTDEADFLSMLKR